jgi:hypothetical protein
VAVVVADLAIAAAVEPEAWSTPRIWQLIQLKPQQLPWAREVPEPSPPPQQARQLLEEVVIRLKFWLAKMA